MKKIFHIEDFDFSHSYTVNQIENIILNKKKNNKYNSLQSSPRSSPKNIQYFQQNFEIKYPQIKSIGIPNFQDQDSHYANFETNNRIRNIIRQKIYSKIKLNKIQEKTIQQQTKKKSAEYREIIERNISINNQKNFLDKMKSYHIHYKTINKQNQSSNGNSSKTTTTASFKTMINTFNQNLYKRKSKNIIKNSKIFKLSKVFDQKIKNKPKLKKIQSQNINPIRKSQISIHDQEQKINIIKQQSNRDSIPNIKNHIISISEVRRISLLQVLKSDELQHFFNQQIQVEQYIQSMDEVYKGLDYLQEKMKKEYQKIDENKLIKQFIAEKKPSILVDNIIKNLKNQQDIQKVNQRGSKIKFYQEQILKKQQEILQNKTFAKKRNAVRYSMPINIKYFKSNSQTDGIAQNDLKIKQKNQNESKSKLFKNSLNMLPKISQFGKQIQTKSQQKQLIVRYKKSDNQNNFNQLKIEKQVNNLIQNTGSNEVKRNNIDTIKKYLQNNNQLKNHHLLQKILKYQYELNKHHQNIKYDSFDHLNLTRSLDQELIKNILIQVNRSLLQKKNIIYQQQYPENSSENEIKLIKNSKESYLIQKLRQFNQKIEFQQYKSNVINIKKQIQPIKNKQQQQFQLIQKELSEKIQFDEIKPHITSQINGIEEIRKYINNKKKI